MQNAVATLRMALHLVISKPNALPSTEARLANFRDSTEDASGLLIIDNADYIAYEGKGRTRTAARNAARSFVPYLLNIMAAPHLAVLATAHDPAWQNNHWQWNEPDIDSAQADLLEPFKTKIPFEGRIGLEGLRTIITARVGSDSPLLEPVIETLAARSANFHQSFHVDPELLLTDPDAALAEVEAGRLKRMRGPRG